MSKHTAEHMTWYKNREIKEGQLNHPSDGDNRKNFDMQYPSFSSEIRNVRLGLSTDGFNPFENSRNKVHTVWYSSKVDTVHNTVGRNEVVVKNIDESILEVFRYPIEQKGKNNVRCLEKNKIIIAEYKILLNMP